MVWDGEPGASAVFDPLTGETHFLNQLPALILSVMDSQWSGLAELVDRLAGPIELDDEAESKLFAALASLERAELVESQLSETE